MPPDTFTDELVNFVWSLAGPYNRREPRYCTTAEAVRHFINCDDCSLTLYDEIDPHHCDTFNLMTRGAPKDRKQGPPVPNEMLDPMERDTRELGRSLLRSIHDQMERNFAATGNYFNA